MRVGSTGADGRGVVTRARARMQSMRSDHRGSAAIIFALVALPIVVVVGAAIDYSRATLLQSGITRAADASTIAAVMRARQQIEAGVKSNQAIKSAEDDAEALYASLLPAGVSAKGVKVDVKRDGIKLSATLKHTVNSTTLFSGLIGQNTTAVSANSVAGTSLSPYVDVALLIDTSGSMAIGADEAAVKLLVNQLGCAFACHDGNPVKGTTMDAYQWAVSQGIKLRTQAVNEGITSFIDYLKSKDTTGGLFRVAIYSFSDTMTRLANYTSNLDTVKQNLPQQTNAASELTGATHFAEIMPAFTLAIGPSGSGASAGAAKKLVIIATDGVQDPNRTWTKYEWLRPLVAPFDPAHCATLKLAGVSVGVIHTPYVPLTSDWGYNVTLGQQSQIGGPATRADDIAGQLKTCASPGLYALASSSDIGPAFRSIFDAMTSTRLTQ